MKVVLVDSGGANINSLRFALERWGVEGCVSDDADEIRGADKVILPGVGAAGEAMRRLKARELLDCIRSLTQPTLGICLGMQLLFEASEEDNTPTLGIIPGRVRRLSASSCLRVPNMGWNTLLPLRASPLTAHLAADDYLYFVHSFAAPVNEATLAVSHHGEPFAAIVQQRNFYGMQFHPERSGVVGARLLKQFLDVSL